MDNLGWSKPNSNSDGSYDDREIKASIEEINSQLENIENSNVNILNFGAKGDGTTDNTEFIQNAINYATSIKSQIYIPNGNFYTGALNVTCNILGEGTLVFKNDSVSNFESLKIVRQDNIKISGISINGNRMSIGDGFDDYVGVGGIYIDASKNIHIENIKIYNSFKIAIYVGVSEHVLIDRCIVNNVRGEWGDGILFTGCKNCEATRNIVYDYTRIGIVTEGNSETKSSYMKINNNTIYNGHSSSILNGGTEYNSGIWCENTNDITVEGNNIYDNTHYGIVYVPITLEEEIYYNSFIIKNKIKNTKWCIMVHGSNKVSTIIEDNILSSFETGISIEDVSNKTVLINRCNFNNSTLNNLNNALVRISDTSDEVNKIIISNCIKTNINYTNNACDISLNYLIKNIDLTIENLKSWTLSDWDTSREQGTLNVNNSEIIFKETEHKYIGSFEYINFNKCKINISHRIFTNVNVVFDNCEIISNKGTVLYFTDKNTVFNNCIVDGATIFFEGVSDSFADVVVNNSKFINYGSFGALLGSQAKYTSYKLLVKNTEFYSDESTVPIATHTFAPDLINFINVLTSSSGLCRDMSPNIEHNCLTNVRYK